MADAVRVCVTGSLRLGFKLASRSPFCVSAHPTADGQVEGRDVRGVEPGRRARADGLLRRRGKVRSALVLIMMCACLWEKSRARPHGRRVFTNL